MSFRTSHPKVFCKIRVLKNFATCLFVYYCGQKPVKICEILISEKSVLSSIFYFEKVLFFADQSINMCWNSFY